MTTKRKPCSYEHALKLLKILFGIIAPRQPSYKELESVAKVYNITVEKLQEDLKNMED